MNWLTEQKAKELGKEIKIKRIQKGYSLEELAKLVGTNKGNLSRYENGMHCMKQKIYERICEVLDGEEKGKMEITPSKTEKKRDSNYWRIDCRLG